MYKRLCLQMLIKESRIQIFTHLYSLVYKQMQTYKYILVLYNSMCKEMSKYMREIIVSSISKNITNICIVVSDINSQ